MTEYNRRHELPESEDDLKALFDELTGPLAEQSRDRLMTDIVNSASWVELQLNDGPEVSDDTFTESLAVLNGDLEGNGVLGEQLIVTGKLRPVLADSIAAEGGTIMDIELPPSISKYGELKRDDEGPYLEVADCELTCGQFAVLAKRGVHFSDASREYQGIILKLGLQPDEESQTLPFYSYLDDIARIEPKEPSFLKIYEMFDNDYPEIAEQLNELPADIRNDQHIVGALASFCLEIDWAKYPRHDEDERQALLEHIETYITNRVNFDTETYELWVYDYLYGVNKDNEQTVIEQPEEKRLAVVVNHVRLEEVETEGKVQRFAVMIEVQASARGHGNGRYRLYIPAANISGIRNLRNNSFRPKGLEITSEEEMFVDDIPVEGAAAIKQAIEQAAGTEAPRSKEQDLIELDMLYKEMLARISVYTARRYSTIKEAREANIAISRILNAFRAAYPAHGVAIEASGPGVIAVNAHWDTDTDFTFDKETGIATIKLHNANTQVGDDLALQRGVFTNNFKGVIDYDVDADDYVVRPFLLCTTTGIRPKDPFILWAKQEGLPLLALQPNHQFAVELNNELVSIDVPELQQIQRAREKIERLRHELPDLPELPGQLSELLQRFVEVDRVKAELFEGIDLITSIGMSVANKERETDLAVAVLEDIFTNRLLEVRGAMYDNAGNVTVSGVVHSKVRYVVPGMPHLQVYEPMLVFEGDKDEDNPGINQRAYVPLSTLQRMIY